MFSDNKNRYKELIRDLADVLIEFIDDLPDKEDNLSQSCENDKDTNPVIYSKRKIKQKPLKFD